MSVNKIDEPPTVSTPLERARNIIENTKEDSIILERSDIQMFLMYIALFSFRQLGTVLNLKNVNANVGSGVKMKNSKSFVKLMNQVGKQLTEAIDD